LHDALNQGAIKCPTAAIYSLDRCVEAHEAVEAAGRDGAILLDLQT
jgi:NADPH2:quinone reductase